MPARSTPRKVLSFTVAAATEAPVLPALTTASAAPDFTMSVAIEMEDFFLRRRALAPDSCISTTSGASTMIARGSFN